jgi:hypothetical protein
MRSPRILHCTSEPLRFFGRAAELALLDESLGSGPASVVAFVGLYRVAGSLLVLRWPFWGGVAAVACDLFDLLLFDLFVVHGGWAGFAGYQAFDKWVDQVYMLTFLEWRHVIPTVGLLIAVWIALSSVRPHAMLVSAQLWSGIHCRSPRIDRCEK